MVLLISKDEIKYSIASLQCWLEWCIMFDTSPFIPHTRTQLLSETRLCKHRDFSEGVPSVMQLCNICISVYRRISLFFVDNRSVRRWGSWHGKGKGTCNFKLCLYYGRTNLQRFPFRWFSEEHPTLHKLLGSPHVRLIKAVANLELANEI